MMMIIMMTTIDSDKYNDCPDGDIALL